MKIRQENIERYHTTEFSAGFSVDTYMENVFNWFSDIKESKTLRRDSGEIHSTMVNCFNSKIKTIDCARYILDKHIGSGLSSKIKINFIPEKLVTSKTLFKENFTIMNWLLTAKCQNDYLILKCETRTRTHRDLNNYELRKLHYSELNNLYKILKY